MKEYGLCSSFILTPFPDLLELCQGDTLTLQVSVPHSSELSPSDNIDFNDWKLKKKNASWIQDLVLNLLELHPTTPVATINSKTDVIQQAYYVLIGALNRSLDPLITPISYYEGINEIYEQ